MSGVENLIEHAARVFSELDQLISEGTYDIQTTLCQIWHEVIDGSVAAHPKLSRAAYIELKATYGSPKHGDPFEGIGPDDHDRIIELLKSSYQAWFEPRLIAEIGPTRFAELLHRRGMTFNHQIRAPEVELEASA